MNFHTQPFDPSGPDCSRDDNANRIAVVSRQWFTVHFNGQNDVTARIQRFRQRNRCSVRHTCRIQILTFELHLSVTKNINYESLVASSI